MLTTLAASSLFFMQAPAQANSTFDRELNRHPYFSCVQHARIESRPPYVFLLQQTGKAESNGVLVERYAENLDPVLELFERELAAPLGWKRRADQRLVVAVLGSPGALVDFRNVAGGGEHFEGQGLYDPSLNAAVVCEDPFHKVRDLVAQERSERHAFLHVCQQAWFAPGLNAPSTSWILEALACELARRDLEAPDKPVAPPAADLRHFLLDLQDERLRWAHGRTLEELCTLSEPQNLGAFFEQQAGPERLPPTDLAAAERAFYRQSTLYLHFLLEGAGRRYRPGCLAFLKQVFAGHPDWQSCAQSFQLASGREIDDAFLAWAWKEARASKGEIDPDVVQKALGRSPAPGSPTNASAATPSPPAPEPPALPTVPELAIDLLECAEDERLAMALYLLGRGRAREGLEILDGLARSAEDESMRARAEREQRRAAAWVELRDSFLRERLASKAEIEFTYKGNKLKSLVLGFTDGRLSLEKHAPSSLSPDQIDPFDLARQIDKSSGGKKKWARIYPYVLQQRKNAAELLESDGGEGSALLADLRSDYPERLRLSELMGRLDEFARLELPAKASEARARIELLATWRREADGLPLLEQKRSALKDHVRTLVTREQAGLEPQKLLRGKLATRKNGTALLTYEFDDPRELEDFSSGGYPSLALKSLGKEQSEDIPFHVEGGRLVARGQASLRSRIEFGAPLSVRYSLEYMETEGAGPRFTCALGICDDGLERFLWAIGLQELECYDLHEVTSTDIQKDPVYMDKVYEMELRHDGAMATLFCEGDSQCSLNTGTRQAGRFFLCTSTDKPVRIERLEVEGHLLPNSFERLKAARIEQELARF